MFNRVAVAVLAGSAAFGIGLASPRQSQAQAGYAFTTIEVPESSLTAATGSIRWAGLSDTTSTRVGHTAFCSRAARFRRLIFRAPWTAPYVSTHPVRLWAHTEPMNSPAGTDSCSAAGTFRRLKSIEHRHSCARSEQSRSDCRGLSRTGRVSARIPAQRRQLQHREFPQSGSGVASAITDSGQIAGLAGSGSQWEGFSIRRWFLCSIQFPTAITPNPWPEQSRRYRWDAGGPQPPTRAFRRSGGNYLAVDLPDAPFHPMRAGSTISVRSLEHSRRATAKRADIVRRPRP
jgi:hypothetical protein